MPQAKSERLLVPKYAQPAWTLCFDLIVLILFWVPTHQTNPCSRDYQVSQVNPLKPVKVNSPMGYNSLSSQKCVILPYTAQPIVNLERST